MKRYAPPETVHPLVSVRILGDDVTYQEVLERAEKVISHDWTKQHIRDFVAVIPSLPAVSAVLTPNALAAAVAEIEQAQASGKKGSVIAATWGAYPLVAKVATQKRSAAILEDSLPRVEQAAQNVGRLKDYHEALRRLAHPDPTTWMAALVEISVFGAADRNGYTFRPYEPAGGRNHDLVIMTPGRQVHLDCLCITRTMIDMHLRVGTSTAGVLSVNPDVDLIMRKIADKAPQIRTAGKSPRGVIITYSGFGPNAVTTSMGVLEAINAEVDFRAFSVFGVANGTAATGVMWFQNPRADVSLDPEEWAELTKIFPAVAVVDNGQNCYALGTDLAAAREALNELDFRFLHPPAQP